MHSVDHFSFQECQPRKVGRIDEQGIHVCSGECKIAANTTQACALKHDRGCWSANVSLCTAKTDVCAACAAALLAP